MKNRTIYDVMNEAMEDYSYSIKKEGNKVEIKGSVTVPRIEIEVSHEKIFYYNQEERNALAERGIDNNLVLSKVIATFKEELKDKVDSVIKEHKEELTDDDFLIRSLTQEVKALQSNLKDTEVELKKAREEIARLELEKTTTQPYQPYPWYPSPWSTGITWDTPYVGDRPGWLDNTITCEDMGPVQYSTDATINILDDAVEHPEQIKYRRFKHNRKNGGER